MKKKVFSLMMTLLLAFVGVAKADVVELGGGSTTTNSYLPTYEFYNYSLTQQIYTADEIGTAGTINSIAFYATSSATRTLNVYMVHTNKTAFSSSTDWITVSAADLVFSGSATYGSGWNTLTLSTPFAYDGTSNLAIIVDDNSGGYVSSVSKYVYDANGNQAIRIYSDGTNYDPYAPTSYSGTTVAQKNCLQIDITPGGGGGGGAEQVIFAVQDGETVDTVYVGPRPNGYWMEPFTFQIRNTGDATTITHLDWTPQEYFTLVDPELPVDIARDEDINVQLTTGETTLTDWQMVAIYGTGRTAAVWNINAEPYDPETPDVWELACTEATSFPFVEVPATAHNATLYNNYTLPFPEIPEGYDAVYKLEFANDMMLDAEVTSGADGKVALYTADFYGEGGPMANNNYQGPTAGAGGGGGGGAAGPFQAMVGDESSTYTTGYLPMYYLYDNSLSTQLYLATELAAAGATTSAMNSISWYSESTYAYNIQNVSIWMANVTATEASATSPLGSGMTLVYQGNFQEVVGWNEFVFNQGSFAWDGTSNVLVMVQMNNGDWGSSIQWKAYNTGLSVSSYTYRDYTAYNAGTESYSMTTSNYRANTMFKSAGRNGNRDIVTIGNQTGTDYYYYPVNMYFNYSLSEQIYTADEIGMAGTINSISFYYNYSSSFSMDNLTLYMKNTEKSEFNSTSDMVAMSLSDIVWSGTLSGASAGWITINLDTPFQYDGTSNLLVGMFDGTSGYPGSSYKFYTHTTTGNKGLTWYSDSYTPDPYTLGSWSGSTNRTSYVNDIQLDITSGGGGGNLPANIAYGPVITAAPVEAGTYYLVASSTDQDFEVTINAVTMPCPQVDGFAFNEIPADDEDEIEPASVTLQWTNPAYATEYQVVFGSTYHPEANHPQTVISDWTPVTGATGSFTVRNLWNNTNYFWHVVFRNAGSCPEGVSSPVWGFTTHLNIPHDLTAVDNTVFDDETITLNWNAVVDRTYRNYFIYRDGVKIGETATNQINATSYTDGPLAYNMNGYVYYVTAVYDEGESAPSNTVTVKVSGRGNVNGHVYEQDGNTGIANATVTMVGEDEFGDSHTYNFTTDNQGYYTGSVYAGTYNGQASCNGYQTIDEPVQGNPIAIDYNQTTSPVDYMLDENFNPVCQVIAEYYPDSLDPNSPYVKVYWGCGLPGGEIIEDFETGDFSQFEWNVSGSYPWEVTTTHPYEGTYCMRSTNYNVASSTSSINVTVDIPADGIMSFFGYISSEANWDYGYFYIDNVQKGSYTGAGNSWGEKKFDITEGTHNFKWEYTKDGSVNSNEDRFYVDYITFYKQPEPAQPGWHTYCESEFNNAVGSNLTTTPSWAYEYPASFLHANYAGWNITKVSLFSDNMYSAVGGNYTCRIYVGGTQPAAGSMVSELTVDVPSNQNAWVDWDLTTPVSVTGNDPIWVVWTANTTVSSWPAGCCGDLNDYGTWWDGGSGWEHLTYGTWTMRHWFTNRAGRSVVLSTANNNNLVSNLNSNLRTPVKGEESNAICANENAVKGAALDMSNTRRFSHYRVYRTDCYTESPYTLYDPAAGEFGNTRVLSCELQDTVYIDTYWNDPDFTPAGVYKWGVGVVYVGNRGEEYESEIVWATPTVNGTRNRDQVFDFEDGQIPSGWTVSAPYPWTVSPDTPTGSYCIKSSNSGVASSTSSIETTVNYTDAGTVSFDALCQGEGTSTFWDHCDFSIDGAVMLTAGANISGWNHYSFPVAAGTHTFKWSYTKDSTVNPTGDAFYVDNVEFSGNGGGGGGGGQGGGQAGTEPVQEPRESVIVWSNCLDKDMYLSDVDVTVLLNSADSPEGTTVTLTNLNPGEQELYPVAPITLDGTGFYAWDTFRRGEYAVEVELEGYETIYDTVDIWEGAHMRYVMIEILYGVENVYVSRTGWAMWDDSHNNPGGGGGGGGQGGQGSTFNMGFDGTTFEDWTTIDANNDGYNWMHSHDYTFEVMDNEGHNGSYGFAVSESYVNGGVGAITPDNYLVSPQVNFTNGSTFTFWATDGNDAYGAEHFGVAISTSGNTNASDFTTIAEWTLLAKGEKTGGERQLIDGIWYEKTVDLSAYAGQSGYIAIRHFNCNDQWVLCVDDAVLTTGAKNADEMEHFEYYKVMCTSIDGVPIYNHNTPYPFCQLSTNEPYNAPLVEGEHYLCKVASVYSTGMSAWSEPVEWEYEPCDHWGPVDEVTVGPNTQGNLIEWTFDHGFNPYDPGTGPEPPVPGDNATIILTAGDVWGDGSGYQMLLDADANAFGTTIPETGALSLNCSGNESIYAEFEYKIPTNADGNCSTQNMVMNNSVTIEIPAGTYDWCITNPTPGDRIWIAAANGNVGGRQDDYVFEAGNTYEFTVSMFGSNDGVNVTITGGAKNRVSALVSGEVKDIANVIPGNYGYIVRPVYSSSNMVGQNFVMTSETSLTFNMADIANYDERVYFLYKLMNDRRFSVINDTQNGVFVVNGNENLNENFVDFIAQNINEFSTLDKYQAADMANAYKAELPNSIVNALMMDLYIQSRENNMCEFADPFCTDNGMYEFPAGVNAGSGEAGPDYDCLYTTPNPAWYYMRIGDPGAMNIHMYSTPQVDIDFCCWGPFDDPTTPCPYGLTEDKVVSCSYSTSWTENCMIPATAQTGEYYILVITNYSNQPCNINFSMIEGEGSTDCGILPPVDIIGFLITMDGEYLAFAGPTDRDFLHEGEFGEHEYCVRPIYPGEMVLPSNNFGWSMGCPVCAGGGQITCEPGAPIHGEALEATDQVKIWWGEETPGPQGNTTFTEGFEGGLNGWNVLTVNADGGEWVHSDNNPGGYDYASHAHGGTGFALCYSFVDYVGAYNTDSYIYTPQKYDIVNGSTLTFWADNANDSYPENFSVCVATADNPTASDFTQVWSGGAKGGAAKANNRHDANRYDNWRAHSVDLSAYAGQSVYIAFHDVNYDMYEIWIDDVELSDGAKGNRANIESYNVYRSTENANYTLIGNVTAVAGQTYYEYIDTPAGAGSYYYQVTAVYADCESDPAASYDTPANDYVVVGVTGIDENDGMAIFPNPTKGNVTIQAAGMQHITVVSVLGQVVYDAEVTADELILNMSQFTAGMYTVRVMTENGVHVERITVIR
jgi:hypothetical protein